MAWCLTKVQADKFRRELKDGTINPAKLATMTSAERTAFFAGRVGEENAKNINALFESKLLLKNQKAGMITWAKRSAGLSKTVERDLISRIERMDKILEPAEGEQFLQELASKRMGVEVSQEEAKTIVDLTSAMKKAKVKANAEGVFPTETDAMTYGTHRMVLDKYVSELKSGAKKISIREEPFKAMLATIKAVPGVAKSAKSTFDNSFWGRQGVKVLLNPRTSHIWVRNFLKSWVDIGRELRGINAMDLIKTDIYSRPGSLNGKYKAGGYELDVLSEEAFPFVFPREIPILSKLLKASEVAFNGGALRLRADLADRYIKMAEKQGINMLSKADAKPIGRLVGSQTGRGSLGKAEVLAREANVLLFSAKFLKSNFDTLTDPLVFVLKKLTRSKFPSKGAEFAKRESAKNMLGMMVTLSSVFALFAANDPDSVDLDPRSTNFGKVKIFGHWTDITGGMGSLVTLVARLVPTQIDGEWGFWFKSSAGKWTKLSTGGFGALTALDIFESFIEGKMAPAAAVVRDLWKGVDFQGQPLTVGGVIKTTFTPMSIENAQELIRDPNSSFIVGSLILEGLGFSTSTSIIPNASSNIIPEGEVVNNGDVVSYVHTYATALNVDPETAFNRIFTGQKIRKVASGTVIVERIPVKESQAIKEERGGKNPTMKLDHTIPLQLGGSNGEDNLKLVTTATHRSYTSVENALGRALKDGRVTKQRARELIIDFKEERISKKTVLAEIKEK